MQGKVMLTTATKDQDWLNTVQSIRAVFRQLLGALEG